MIGNPQLSIRHTKATLKPYGHHNNNTSVNIDDSDDSIDKNCIDGNHDGNGYSDRDNYDESPFFPACWILIDENTIRLS